MNEKKAKNLRVFSKWYTEDEGVPWKLMYTYIKRIHRRGNDKARRLVASLSSSTHKSMERAEAILEENYDTNK